MLTNDKRAHDLAVAISRWQLDHIKGNKENPVQVNIYAIYRRNYTEILNTLSQDPDFQENETGITMNKTNASEMNKPQRAHDVAVSVTRWQLDHLNLTNVDKSQPVKINVYAMYKRNYTDVLNTLNKDDYFNNED